MNVIPKFISSQFSAERKAATISGFLLFSTIAAFIILKSARDAFFLARFNATTLPYFMGLTTVITAFAAAVYLRLYKRISIETGVKISLLLFSFITLLFWRPLDRHNRILISLLYAWVSVFGTLATVQAWLLISQQFLTREARRQIGVIGAGGVIGGIVGGLLARFISNIWTAHALLPLAALCIFAAFLASLLLSAPNSNVQEQVSETDQQTVGKKFIWLILVVVAIGTLVSTFIEFQFKTGAQQEFRTERHLAVFFGSFYAYTGAATLIIQLIATPFLLRRFGITTTLSFLPFALLLTNGAAFLTASFTAIIIVKLTEELFKHSVDRSSIEVLYVAIPEAEKIRLKSLVDTIGVRAAEGIGAVVLILLFSLLRFTPQTLIIINIVFVVVWVVATILLGKEYPELLRNRIKRKELDFERVKEDLFSTDFYRLLPQILQEGESQNINDVLDILGTSNHRWLGRYLMIALQHQDATIRLKTLRLLFQQDANLSAEVKKLLSDSDRKIRAEAVHYLCLRSHLKKEEIQEFLETSDPILQAAVCSYALREKPEEGIVYEKFEQLIKESLSSSDIDTRLEIAHVLEFATASQHTTRICALLLSDPEQEVRKAALKMIARVHPPGMFPTLIRLMRATSLLTEVRAALGSYGELLVPRLRKIVEDETASVEQKKLALKVAGDIGGPQTLGFLLEIAKEKQLPIRFAALKALNRLCRHSEVQLDQTALSALLEEELAMLEKQSELYRRFSPSTDHLLHTVLRQRRRWGIERIFRLLGLLYDTGSILAAYHGWLSGNFRKMDTALEFLDTLITPALRLRILPLLELHNAENSESDTDIKAVYDQKFDAQEMARKEAFFSIFQEKDPVVASLAITDLSQDELGDWQQEIQKALGNFEDGKLVDETLLWRLNMQDSINTSEQNTLTTVQKMEHLNKIDMFSRLGAHELLLLADISELKTYEPGEEIYKEGDYAEEISCLIEGSVELHRSAGHVRTVSPGSTFGTHGVLVNKPHLFTAIAKTRCTCLRIERDSFREVLEEYPGLARGIFGVLVEQIETLTDKMLSARVGQ